ncbi:TonB-dependent receptor [Sphingomonas koreensis]|nr:TonB-dependent receptor [Sphingomonas koreensis]
MRAGVAPLAILLAGLSTPAFAQDGGAPTPDDQSTAAPAATAATPPAQASDQTATPDQAPAEATQDIVVTGSVFRRANTETPSPVTVLTSDALQQRGINTVTDAIQSLTANGSGNLTNSFSANGAFAAGASAPSLRGLTTDSTLVLFDGLRGSYYPLADDGARNFVDTNTIPDAIVDRVEVLKDGASATYGADAVAGVVNIILKKQITGFHGLAEGGVSQRGDDGEQHLSATYGYGDLDKDGFNVYANVEYQHDSALYNRDRGFPYNTGDLRAITGTAADGGIVHDVNGNPNGLSSTGVFQGLGSTIVPYVRPINADGTLGTGQVINTAAGCQGLIPHAVGETGTDAGNVGTVCEQDLVHDYSVISPSQERLGGTLHATANVGDNAQAYAVFTYYQNRTIVTGTPQSAQQTSYTGNFSTVNTIALPTTLADGSDNPNNPFDVPALLYYRFGDIPQTTEQFSQTYRGAIGINGTFGDDWGYSFDATGMKTDLKSTFKGYIYGQGLLDAVNDGTYNFVDPSQNTQAVRDSIAPTAYQYGKSELYQAQGLITKDLVQLPGGALQLGVGGAVRYESLNDPSANPGAIDPANPDPSQQYFNLNPFYSSGKRWVESAYFELNAPIIKPLELDLSGRYDHYSTGFSHFSPKVGAKFTVARGFAIRGTFSKGFRVPSFAETNSSTIGFTPVTPPDSFRQEHLGADGKPDAYAQSYSLGLNTVGNPNLKPEKSTNFTGGAIIQPLPWLSFTADYYYIKKTDVITAASNKAAIDAYYAGDAIPEGFTVVQDAADPSYPQGSRRLLLVGAPYVNASSLVTSGLDLQGTANIHISDDISLQSSGEASYVFKLNQKYPGGETQHYAGTIGPYAITSASGTPRWRAQWQNTLSMGRYSLTATAYYTSGYKESAEDVSGAGSQNDCYGNTGDTGVPTPYEDGITPIRCNVKSFIDVDLHGAIKVTDNFTFYGDVLNVLGAKAPLDPTTYGAYQYNSSWSQAGVVGRYFKIGANFSF